ncbi:MAG: MGDG synthase family glycosyltransferase, partial [Syntrophothermus sp.]
MHKAKYLFLYLRTGGGHLAPARSVAEYLKQNYADSIEPVLIDGFAEAPAYARFIVEDGYRILQSKAKWYYEMLYATNKIISLAKINKYLVSRQVLPYLERKLLEEKPEKIVIFHFFLIKPVYELVRKHKLDPKIITVVTDPFTAHPIWFVRKDQDWIIFSDRLKDYLIRKNIPAGRLHVFPFILNDRFNHPVPKEELPKLKNRMGFSEDQRIILIVGGGDGIPKGEKIVRRIVQSLPRVQIAVVCGKNKALFDQLMHMKEKRKLDRLKIYGYVDFIYELINISDVVITKCGASTFMEILMMHKIPVVNSYLWEQ